jgi:hypothetical protein
VLDVTLERPWRKRGRRGKNVIKILNQYYKQRNKYKSKPKEYGGRVYHSGMEADQALWLDVMVKDGRLKEVKPQHKLSFNINGKHITTHIVDFLVTLPDGRQKLVEIKGFPTELWRVKMKLAEALYPETEYLVNPNERKLLE